MPIWSYPGPGCYEPKTKAFLSRTSSAIFGTTPRNVGNQTARLSTARRPPLQSKGNQTARPGTTGPVRVPGPGAYNVDSSSKTVKTRSSKCVFGRRRRFESDVNANYVPGPRYININDKGITNKSRMTGTRSRKTVFGTARAREPLSARVKNKVPGPARYGKLRPMAKNGRGAHLNLTSRAGDASQVRARKALGAVPGPGQYNLGFSWTRRPGQHLTIGQPQNPEITKQIMKHKFESVPGPGAYTPHPMLSTLPTATVKYHEPKGRPVVVIHPASRH